MSCLLYTKGSLNPAGKEDRAPVSHLQLNVLEMIGRALRTGVGVVMGRRYVQNSTGPWKKEQ